MCSSTKLLIQQVCVDSPSQLVIIFDTTLLYLFICISSSCIHLISLSIISVTPTVGPYSSFVLIFIICSALYHTALGCRMGIITPLANVVWPMGHMVHIMSWTAEASNLTAELHLLSHLFHVLSVLVQYSSITIWNLDPNEVHRYIGMRSRVLND